jgi:uncharacterized protein YukJ
MGLRDGYGVVIGAKSKYYRDNPDNFGRYYHGNLEIQAAGKIYHCAIDVDPKNTPDGVQWRVATIDRAEFAAILALGDGWHDIASNSTSGALDYIRSTLLHHRRIFIPSPGGILGNIDMGWVLDLIWGRWQSGRGTDALEALEGVIADGKRFYVFGEPFASGPRAGLHNVHQNQGDPIGSSYAIENAIWQDGGTIVEKADGQIIAFLNKFKTQANRTDDLGRPT